MRADTPSQTPSNMPKSIKKPTREQLLAFVQEVASVPDDPETADWVYRLLEKAQQLRDGNFRVCQGCGRVTNDFVQCPDEEICRDCLNGVPA